MKTDSQIQQDVMAELKWEPAVQAEQIGVEVKDGIVTLAGHVDSFAEKWNAERAAQRVSGVKALAVEIDVKLPGSDQRTDADIAQSCENVLLWTTYLPKDSVKVMVESGWVTLTGHVKWEFQRATANAAIRYLAGVKGVSNQVAIKPDSATAAAVKSDIEAALKRRAVSEAQHIKVEVNGNEVTLSGKVPSWADRDAAGTAAWASPGVSKVVDNIAISY
jgi:osmotically-inducible protein OsmY